MVITAPHPADTPRAVPSAPRLTYLEGLRALAALWVMLSHMWISQCGKGTHSGLFGLASNWLLYSHLAVDVFIVLSGYCLYLPVQRDGGLLRAGPLSFYWHRARRILPPYLFALTFAVVISLLLERLDGAPCWLDIRALGVNLLLLQDAILHDNVFDGPLWSIAVEWRLSLLFPLLVWGLRQSGRPRVLLAAAVIGYSLTALVFANSPGLLMSSPWYLLLFTIGLCAASLGPTPLGLPNEERSWTRSGWFPGIVGSLAALVLLLRTFPVTAQEESVFGRHMPVIDLAVGVLAALMLVGLRQAFEARRAFALRLLSWRPLAALGTFSYSLYLTHEPLIRILVRLMSLWPTMTTAPLLLRFGLLVGVGTPLLIGFAYLFFFFCERPFMKAMPIRRSSGNPVLALS